MPTDWLQYAVTEPDETTVPESKTDWLQYAERPSSDVLPQPTRKVFLQDRGITVEAPADVPMEQVEDFIQREVYDKEGTRALGTLIAATGTTLKETLGKVAGEATFNAFKGSTQFFARMPQMAGSLLREFAETAQTDITPRKFLEAKLGSPLALLHDDDLTISQKLMVAGSGNLLVEPFLYGAMLKRTLADRTHLDERMVAVSQRLSSENRRWLQANRLQPDPGGLNEFFFNVGSGTSSLLTALGIAYTTRNPAMAGAFFGVVQNADLFDEARDAGQEPQAAAQLAGIGGIAEASLEAVGLEVFMNTARASRPLMRALVRAGDEVVQEALQQTAEEVIAKYGFDRPGTLTDVVKRIGMAALVGGVVGAPVGSVMTFLEQQEDAETFRRFSEMVGTPTVERMIEPQQTAAMPMAAEALSAAPVAEGVKEGVAAASAEPAAVEQEAPAEPDIPSTPLTDPEFEQAVTEIEQAQAPRSDAERAAELEIDRELLQESLQSFRERVGTMRRPAGDFLKEELSQMPKSYFTDDPTAPTLDEQAANLGFEGINELLEAISTFEQLKPERMQRLKDVTQSLRELRKTVSGQQQAVQLIRQRIVRRLKGRLPPEAAAAASLERVPLAQLREALVTLQTAQPASPEEAERLVQPILTRRPTPMPAADYAQNRQQPRPASPVRRVVADVQALVDRTLVPISTRLSKISESLKHRVRRFDFDVNTKTQANLKIVEPMLERMAALPEPIFADLDFALKNRDEATVSTIVAEHHLHAEFQAVRGLLDDIYQRARSVGMDVRYLEAYFPRRVKDVSAFLDYLRKTEQWSAIAEAIRFREAELARILTPEERVELINLLIRGRSDSPIRLALPGNVKERLIDRITPALNQFYKPSSTALVEYVTGMNNAIEQRRFFGQDAATIDQSIGAYLNRLVEQGEIHAADEQRARDILKARFEQRGTQGIVSLYKNLAYIYTMGSPISAITQIGDLAFALYENGYYETGRILGRSVAGRTVLSKEDIGLSRIAEEFTGESAAAKAVSKVFRLIGLDQIDAIGKNALLQGAWDRLTTQAQQHAEALTATLQPIFGDEAAAVVADLQQGRASDHVKYLMFSELADMQPVALSEMPETYLTSGNWRIFYMLKTYTIKQLDIYHNEVVRQMRTNPAKALSNLVRLTAALMLMGAASDEIKDVLLGRPKDLSEVVIDNLLKLMGFNKWTIYKARQEGLPTAFMQSALPPMPFFDDLYLDVVGQRDLPNWRLWGRVPVVGKFYYWWFGGGVPEE